MAPEIQGNEAEKKDPGPVWRAIWFSALPFLIALTVAMTTTAYVQQRNGVQLPTGPAPTVAQLLRLSTLPEREAPPFVLTDQHGLRTSLSAFHGKVVLVLFIDPRCITRCSDTARLLAYVDHKLGRAATRVAMVGVDVNPNHESLQDIQRFNHAQRLDRLTNWHLVTGSTADLSAVWSGYGVAPPTQPIGTSSTAPPGYWYFVNPFGRLRFIAEPGSGGSDTGHSGLSTTTIDQLGNGLVGFIAKSASG